MSLNVRMDLAMLEDGTLTQASQNWIQAVREQILYCVVGGHRAVD